MVLLGHLSCTSSLINDCIVKARPIEPTELIGDGYLPPKEPRLAKSFLDQVCGRESELSSEVLSSFCHFSFISNFITHLFTS